MNATPAVAVRPHFLVSDLCALLENYLPPEQVREVYRAYLLGAQAHEGQHRATGEPYIYHPVEVAHILGEMRLDYQTVVAALLHDVIEDTPISKQDLVEEFGQEVADLVDGVSKLTQIEFESRAEAQAENFRKMLLAMTQDIRVILVKLADRLHNMRTLSALRPEKRRAIARETLDIYAPIANRLGLNHLRLDLEDLGFAALHPRRYQVLEREVRKARGNRKEVVKRIEGAIRQRLRQEELEGEVLGREKHLYSLYRKMKTKRVPFSEVLDVYAFRILVDRVDTCYRVLGAVHNLFKPVPGRFKDYIAIPKANGYQSLHTVLFGPYGVPIEVQIRTHEMHAVAEAGIAAHWLYKSGEGPRGSNAAHARAREWMREILELQKTAGNSMEFIESVKVDLFPDEVYVFTPRGDIMELPRGATAVDFAYAVHTDVGNTCVAAKIDRRYAPLSTPLESGQTVEVVSAPWGRPNPNWLNFVVTGKARSNIRTFLKNLQQDEAVELGRRLLKNALANDSLLLEDVPPERIDALLRDFSLPDFNALLADVGLGNRIATLVARRLAPPAGEERPAARRPAGGSGRPLAIRGTEGMVVSFGRCCRPIPGDPIHGFVSAGRGIVVHTLWCKNVAEHLDRPEKLIPVQWEDDIEGEFPVEVRIELANQKGALATVAAAISGEGANIENVSIDDRDGLYTSMSFVIDVHDRQHLARIMRQVRLIRLVHRITRARS
jgi:RelA/SpoT family (p)ppGpp synthetase